MASTFFGLTIGTSGLRAYQASANTVANNISNVDTKGYSKQVTNRKQNNALRSFTEYGTLSAGVSAESVTQLRSKYYDNKFWQYSGYQGEYDDKVKYMSQIESYFQDDNISVQGFSSIYTSFFTDLDSLRGDPSNTSVRNQVISGAKKLCSYFNATSTALKKIQEDLNDQINTSVDTINSIGKKIALLNDQINDVEINGSYANDMRDQRALLIDQLSTMVSVEVQETKVVNSHYPDMYTGATNYEVKINGLQFVDGNEFRQLKCEAREYKDNQNDADGLYDIKWADNDSEFNACSYLSAGSLKALVDLRDGNNHENFRGTIQKVAGREVTIMNANLQSENSLNMPPEGRITLGSREYTYSSFSIKRTVSGEMEYTFTISGETTGLTSMTGREAFIGNSIDFKGIAYYQDQMNEFLRAFTKSFNDIEKQGEDLYGNQMNAFFVAEDLQGVELGFTESANEVIRSDSDSYYQLTAANLKVADASAKDPSIFATIIPQTKPDEDGNDISVEQGESKQSLVEMLQKLQSDVVMYRGSGGDKFLDTMINDVVVDSEESQLLSENYGTIVSTIGKQRTSISGVDEDEEALDLMKYQNAYDLCSKVIQIMSEMYDRLINNTGV